MRARLVEIASLLVAAAASVAFGLTFGFTYGVNNQVHYMLGALRLGDPSVLANDWLAGQTLNYHPAFAAVGWLLLKLGGPSGWGIGVGTTVAASAGAMSVYWLARRLFTHAVALPAFLLTVAAMIATNTREVAWTYAFDPIFQPSTIASAALLASLAPFVQGRWLLAGVIFAVGGLFHVNYLVLGIGIFGVAHLALGRQDWKHRVLHHLAPPLAVLLVMSPLIVKAALGSGDTARAHQILFEIRSPHHYHLRGFIDDFFGALAWQTLGLGLCAWVLTRGEGRGRRFGALLAGFVVVIWGITGTSVVFSIDRATELFGWRLLAHVDILMQLIVAATVARLLVAPGEAVRITRSSACVALTGGIVLAMVASVKNAPTVDWLVHLAEAAVLGVAFRVVAWKFPSRPVARASALIRAHGGWVASVAAAVLVYMGAKGPLDSIEQRSNLFRGMPGAETDLYTWIRANTPRDATFLTPPGLERFRLASQRPIVADWKAIPYAAKDILEWYRRLEDVSGRRGFRTRDEIVGGYDGLDKARLDSLRDKYHLTYAVVGRGHDGALGRPVLYANGQFVVLDLR